MPTRPAKSVRRELLGAALTDHDHVEADITDLDHYVTADFTTDHTAVSGDHVTNGDTHDHSGGDGAQVDHGGLSGLADDDHTQYYNDTRHNTSHAGIRVQRSTSDQAITPDTNTTVIFNNVVNQDDPSGVFTHNTGTGVLTINSAGWFLVTAGINWSGLAAGDRQRALLVKNGVVVNISEQVAATSGSDQSVSDIITAAATDTVEIRAFHDNETNANVDAQPISHMSVVKLRA